MCFFKDEFRYNFKSQHIGVVKEKKNKKYKSVFISTKEYDEGRKNLPMDKNVESNNSTPSYFITRVRSYPKNTYGPKLKGLSFSKSDRRTANRIFKEHKQNSRIMAKRKHKKRNRYHS